MSMYSNYKYIPNKNGACFTRGMNKKEGWNDLNKIDHEKPKTSACKLDHIVVLSD